jgi:MHS family shikimate/dehydroshikimate transporter-like MFS transporter
VHRRSFLTAVGLKLSEISYASIATVFAISYVTGQLTMPRSVILNAIVLAAVVALAAIPIFGWLSDKVGRKAMFFASSLFAMVFAFPIFWLLDTRDPATITLTIITAIIFGQIVGFGVGAPWYSELFAARLRYSGASLGFQIGAAISGGLTPFAAATFMAWTGGATWPISVYLIALALITFVATMAAPETAGKPLRCRVRPKLDRGGPLKLLSGRVKIVFTRPDHFRLSPGSRAEPFCRAGIPRRLTMWYCT